jgi:hypothetical protein
MTHRGTVAWNGRRMATVTLIRPLATASLIALLAAGAAGCGGTRSHPTGPATSPAARPTAAGSDPATATALLRIAQAFNNDYDNGNFGAVYDRWDASSQAIISRAEYIRRHALCAPATHSVAQVEGAARGRDGAWHVSYRIDGNSLVDTWFYARHRWVFDITLSNPAAARNYSLPFARYAAAVGCTTH